MSGETLLQVTLGLVIPFAGTAFGALCVLFLKNELKDSLRKGLTGFAAGVMVAASIWSLLIPSIEKAKENGMGTYAFIPAAAGFCIGMIFLLILDSVIPHTHMDNTEEGPESNLNKSTMLVLAVVLHNIPEGMAAGVVLAGFASGNVGISLAAALSLSIGLAIQNFPEGAIISMPLAANGMKKRKACFYGIMSGIVEPIAAILTILLTGIVVPVLPYLLSFAGGAMIYVVVEELIPEMSEGEHSNASTVLFMLGFVLMMILDVTLG